MSQAQIKLESELAFDLEVIELSNDETEFVAGGPEVDNDPRKPP